jgi:predicted  nucleic acid-binding Zn-ribbon protein
VAKSIKIQISAGELIDKITILELKTEYIKDKDKLGIINKELKLLNRELDYLYYDFPKLKRKLKSHKSELYKINNKLWETENKLRVFESYKDFKDDFIEAARKVYIYNDKRSKIKNKINELLGSKLNEVKDYTKY